MRTMHTALMVLPVKDKGVERFRFVSLDEGLTWIEVAQLPVSAEAVDSLWDQFRAGMYVRATKPYLIERSNSQRGTIVFSTIKGFGPR